MNFDMVKTLHNVRCAKCNKEYSVMLGIATEVMHWGGKCKDCMEVMI